MNIYEVEYHTYPKELAHRAPFSVTSNHVAFIEAKDTSKIDGILKERFKELIEDEYWIPTITSIVYKEVILIKNKE